MSIEKLLNAKNSLSALQDAKDIIEQAQAEKSKPTPLYSVVQIKASYKAPVMFCGMNRHKKSRVLWRLLKKNQRIYYVINFLIFLFKAPNCPKPGRRQMTTQNLISGA
ncbi:hypothetical protein [Acinetobacter baumannii]|uniref:hypothetical protein n=1 Tax=Acinetobacter baumannii TaxID=470 RepID=UPI003B42E6B6